MIWVKRKKGHPDHYRQGPGTNSANGLEQLGIAGDSVWMMQRSALQPTLSLAAAWLTTAGLHQHRRRWEAPERSAKGEILTNEKFPDMKALSDYVHRQGLKNRHLFSRPLLGGYLQLPV